MKKNKQNKPDNIVKRWYKLCQPNKKDWAMQIITYSLYAIVNACMAIFAAKTINCLYNSNWNGAFFWLGVEFLDILIRNLFYHLEYYYYGKVYGQINKTLCGKIYDKIMSVSNTEIKKFSPEKIISIAQSNTSYACEFPDYVASMVSRVVYIIVAIVAVLTSSWWAGIIIMFLAVVNFFVYKAAHKKLGYHLKRRCETKDDSFREYSRIIKAKDVITELGAEDEYKQKILHHVDNFNGEYLKYYMIYSFKENLFFVIWNAVVYIITAVLIFLVSKNMFDIALYLIVVPYLSSCTTKFNELFDKFGSVESTRVDVDRLNLILSLSDKELISYGNVNTECEGYNLGFVNVTYTDKDDPKLKIKSTNIAFKMNAINEVRGERGSGKRIVFDILRRQIKPDDGIVLLDNLNLFDYANSTFKNHIDYCAQHPLFISGTIMENLKATKRDLTKLNDLIAELGLTEVIARQKDGLNTQIDDVTNPEDRFWVGIIRAALSKCKILMIYEYPNTDNPEFHSIFQNIIKTCETDKRTLILFTHNAEHDQLADVVFEVKNNSVKKIKG